MHALAANNQHTQEEPATSLRSSKSTGFIEANTMPITIQEIEQKNIIPVFSKDNETAISHVEFIQAAYNTAQDYFKGVELLQPIIRVSHPIKGRVPEARNKPANELQEHERTLYYERMAFLIEIPEISREIQGNRLNLVIGGVKAYNLDNLFNKKGTPETFKVFIGFQNKVCLNLCVWTDGLKEEIKVSNLLTLTTQIHELISNYDAMGSLVAMEQLAERHITEHQFAQLIGKSRLYNYLPTSERKALPAFQFLDCHINAIANDYYADRSFCRNNDGTISLWRLYNLFTGANRNSYIDKYLSRGVNASQFITSLNHALTRKQSFWFIE
jgi:hypothetical protein